MGGLFPEVERLGEEQALGRTRSPAFPVPRGLPLGTANGITQGSEFSSMKSAVGPRPQRLLLDGFLDQPVRG